MIIALNNKSNLNKEEFINYLKELEDIKYDKLILCPTSINIPLFNLKNMELGSQDVSEYDTGAHTGEESAKTLKSYGVKYSIVGHSERRKEGETSEETNYKINRLLEEDMIPILCVGESLEQRENNTYIEFIMDELEKAFNNIKEIDKIIIAYEPIYSIGTEIIPKNEEIEEVIKTIKDKYPNNKVLYGGSVNEENISIINNISIIDGYLLGGISLKPNKLKELISKIIN